MSDRYLIPAGFARFDKDSGLVTAFGRMGIGHIEDAVANGESIIDVGLDLITSQPLGEEVAFYIDPTTKKPVTRTPISALVDKDRKIITGLPIPCQVRIDNQTIYDVDDGELELSFEHPGDYMVEILSTAHLTQTLTVTNG